MNSLEFNEEFYRRSYKASESLRHHRTQIIAGALVFWTGMLTAIGYFREFGQTDARFLIFGFFWMTIPMSLATYGMPRLLLRVVPLMNGYKPENDG